MRTRIEFSKLPISEIHRRDVLCPNRYPQINTALSKKKDQLVLVTEMAADCKRDPDLRPIVNRFRLSVLTGDELLFEKRRKGIGNAVLPTARHIDWYADDHLSWRTASKGPSDLSVREFPIDEWLDGDGPSDATNDFYLGGTLSFAGVGASVWVGDDGVLAWLERNVPELTARCLELLKKKRPVQPAKSVA